MNAPGSHDQDRLSELLADEAAAGLENGARGELENLLARHPELERDTFLKAASLAQVSFLRREARGTRAMPAALRQRLAAQGQALVARNAQRTSPPVSDLAAARARRQPAITTTGNGSGQAAGQGGSPRHRWLSGGSAGWAVAAMLALAFLVLRPGPPVELPVPGPAAARSALLATAPDALTAPWNPPTEAGYESVTGDVVWSRDRQEGYLRLAGLPVNDPAVAQYQLWIIDPERDSRHPVDGGVFDVTASGEIIIPIRAKLPVGNPRAFAITLEQPGGVVVSAGPLLVVAAAG